MLTEPQRRLLEDLQNNYVTRQVRGPEIIVARSLVNKGIITLLTVTDNRTGEKTNIAVLLSDYRVSYSTPNGEIPQVKVVPNYLAFKA